MLLIYSCWYIILLLFVFDLSFVVFVVLDWIVCLYCCSVLFVVFDGCFCWCCRFLLLPGFVWMNDRCFMWWVAIWLCLVVFCLIVCVFVCWRFVGFRLVFVVVCLLFRLFVALRCRLFFLFGIALFVFGFIYCLLLFYFVLGLWLFWVCVFGGCCCLLIIVLLTWLVLVSLFALCVAFVLLDCGLDLLCLYFDTLWLFVVTWVVVCLGIVLVLLFILFRFVLFGFWVLVVLYVACCVMCLIVIWYFGCVLFCGFLLVGLFMIDWFDRFDLAVRVVRVCWMVFGCLFECLRIDLIIVLVFFIYFLMLSCAFILFALLYDLYLIVVWL